MTLQVAIIPCLQDNYAYLIHNDTTKETALVDAPEAAPILAALAERGWTLTDVLLTHHHWDHVEGLAGILEVAPARVIGAQADIHRLPPLDLAVSEGDEVMVCGEPSHIIDVSGHTVNHIAFYFPKAKYVFTGDSLMAMGCGRLFEGAPELMWASLSKLAALPHSVTVCSGHEYTQSNVNFAKTVEPDNAALMLRERNVAQAVKSGTPTAMETLEVEHNTNPFLRAHLPEVKALIGVPEASDAEAFAEIRARKDRF